MSNVGLLYVGAGPFIDGLMLIDLGGSVASPLPPAGSLRVEHRPRLGMAVLAIIALAVAMVIGRRAVAAAPSAMSATSSITT